MHQDHLYFIYILASKSRRLYVGVTNDLEARVWQHKTEATISHTSRYNIDRLVYFEDFQDVNQAIAREKQVKKWRGQKKVALIEGMNPTWRDLSAEWFKDVSL